jgi:hypothetical protein
VTSRAAEAREEAASQAPEAEGGAPGQPGITAVLHIVKIEVKSGASEAAVKELLAPGGLGASKGGELFESLRLTRVTASMAEMGMTIDAVAEGADFGKFSYWPPEGDSAGGLDSFLRHAALDSFELRNFKSFHRDRRTPGMYQTTALERAEVRAPDVHTDLRSPSNAPDLFLNLAAESVTLSNFWVNLTYNAEEIFKTGFGKIEAANLK